MQVIMLVAECVQSTKVYKNILSANLQKKGIQSNWKNCAYKARKNVSKI